MRTEDGGGGSKPYIPPPAPKPAPSVNRGPGTRFALKNDGGVKRPAPMPASRPPAQPAAPHVEGRYRAGSQFALKNDGAADAPSPQIANLMFSGEDGARVESRYRPGSQFALKNDGSADAPSPQVANLAFSGGDGERVEGRYRPGSLFALKNDGPVRDGSTEAPVPPTLTDGAALAVAGQVHDAMYGDLVGTREGEALSALRGLSAAEVRQVAYQYEIKYKGLDPEHTTLEEFQAEGSALYTRLQGELQANGEIGASGHDWAQAQSLLRGDVAKADAIALQTALERPWLLPGGRADEILSILRRAEPAERQALVEAFAKDFAERDHTIVRGRGATQVAGTGMPEYDPDPTTLVMNVLKAQLGGGDWVEAVGLLTAAKYVDRPAVVAHAQGEAAIGRLYGLLDRPLPDRAAALALLQNLGPQERDFVQGLASDPGGTTKLGQLLESKLTDAEFQQATAYLEGDAATAQATALHAALTRTAPAYGYQVPAPDVAAAERILGELASDDERRALLAAFERQYHQDPASLVPAVVGSSRREVMLAQLQTAPVVLESGSSTLTGLGPGAVETGIDYRASLLRRAIDSHLVGVTQDDVRLAFSGLDVEQARQLAAQPLRPGEPGSRTLGEELAQWYRAGGGGRFTLEYQQMLDGDAAAVRDRQQLIDEAQAQYTLETTGPLVGVNDSIQRLFGNDARAVLDYDAARLRAAEAALQGDSPAVEPARTDMAVAYVGTGLHDYRVAKEATTEAAKTVVTTAAVVGTTVATAGTAAAVWAPVVAGATANVAASQLNGASNGWQDNAIAVVEGAANGLTLPVSGVAVRGGQYVVLEVAEQGGQQVLRNVSRSLAREAVEKSLAEGAGGVLAQGGQFILRDAGRELTIRALRPTLAQAVGQNVAEGVAGSIVGDVAAGTLRGELDPQQVAANAVLAAGTAGLLSLGLAGASRLAASPAHASEVEGAVSELGSGRPIEIDAALSREGSASALDSAPLPQPKPELRIGTDVVVQRKLVDPVTRRPEFLALGFHPERPTELKQVLESTRHLITADTLSGEVFNGTLYTVKTDIVGPNGHRGALTAFWELRDGEDVPALVSAVIMRVDDAPVAAALAEPPRITPPQPHPESGVNLAMQEAFVTAMRETDVVEIGLRPLRPDGTGLWHGIGGGTVRDASGTVRNPGPPSPLQPELVDGRWVFPRGPIKGTGAIFPTKPGGAVTLTPEHVQTIDAARADRGLRPLHEAYPHLPLPRQVTLPDGTTAWAQQLMFGGVRPVLVNTVRDASGRIVDGDMLLAGPDVDLVYAIARDGHLLSDDEIDHGLRPAINRVYSEANFPRVQYDIVNHGAQANGIRNPAIRDAFQLDKPEYWNGPVHKFRADALGYTETANFADTFRRLVDPAYVPAWVEARIAALESQGHGFRRHGWQVTAQQLEDRVRRSIDPVTGTRIDAFTGQPHIRPRHATRVNTPEAYIQADEHIRNSPAFRDAIANRQLDFVTLSVRLEEIYGSGYRDHVFGRTRVGSKKHPAGVVDTDFTDGMMKAIYRRDAAGGWVLHTMFPAPKR